MKTALITGITGQAGSYLSRLLRDKDYRVIGTTRDLRLAKQYPAEDIELIAPDLFDLGQVTDLLDVLRPDEIYHFAAPSSVARSFKEPVSTTSSLVIPTLNLLEAVCGIDKQIRILHAASSEMFGDCTNPAVESTPLDPHSPYGVGKAASFLQTKNYREAFDTYCCSAIFFNFESPLRQANFGTKKIISSACQIANGDEIRLDLGNIDIHRDWGWAPEYMEASWRMLQQDDPEDLIIATGQMHSLKEFLEAAFDCVGLNYLDHVSTDPHLLRPFDIKRSVGNPEKAARSIEWKAQYSLSDLVEEWVDIETKRHWSERKKPKKLRRLSDKRNN